MIHWGFSGSYACFMYSIILPYVFGSVPACVQMFNPLTTDDECTRHETLAACYQLAQSILKIGFALAKKVG